MSSQCAPWKSVQCGLEASTIDAGTGRCKSYAVTPQIVFTWDFHRTSLFSVPLFSELVCEIWQFGNVRVLMGITGGVHKTTFGR